MEGIYHGEDTVEPMFYGDYTMDRIYHCEDTMEPMYDSEDATFLADNRHRAFSTSHCNHNVAYFMVTELQSDWQK